MLNGLPLIIVVLYTVFTLFQFYQALHIKKFRGASQAALLVINICAFAGMLFSYGYLVYYGIAVAWYWPIALFVIAFAVKTLWFYIEAKLGLKNHIPIISLAGLLVLPVSGFFLVVFTP